MKRKIDLKKDVNIEADVEKAKKNTRNFIKEFSTFATRGNMIDLAIGVVIGSAFTSIVNSFVNDIIMPVISLLTKGLDFSELFFTLDGKTYESLSAAQEAGVSIFSYGNFITAIIKFLLIALFIFIVFKKILVPRPKKNAAPVPITKKDCPYCKMEIAIEATRCPHCTSELEE